MNEDEISETLDKVVPHREVPEGMLAGARRRRRRTRALTGGAAVAVVVALAVPLGLTMGNSGPQVLTTPAPTPSRTATAGTASLEPEACRDSEGNYPDVTELPDGQLPEGATRVWLCGGPSAQSFAKDTFVGAPEPLTESVAEAIAAFNAVPTQPGKADCSTSHSLGFSAVFDYPDGERRVVQGGLDGCDAVLSADAHRQDARSYLEALRSLWDAQRSELGTAFDAAVDVCPARTSVMGVGIADMTRAYACVPVGDSDPATESVQIPLSGALVADIVDEITSQDVMAGIEPGIAWAAPSLVFLSNTGDPYTILGTPEGYHWYDPEPTGMNLWQPSPGLAARMYDELTRDGVCTAPPRLVPSDVTVDVYDAGGGATSVELVVEHLAEAGFAVTNTGDYVAPSMGSAIIVRSGGTGSGAATALVESQFNDTSGEVSRQDDVVDVLVTSLFHKAVTHFAAEPLKDAADGSLTCTAPSASPSPSSSATPATWPSQTPPPTVGEQGQADMCERNAEDRMTPTDLPNNTLPDGPVAVWLCTRTGSPPEPLVGEQAMQTVVDTFRALPTASDGGLYPAPNHAYVLVDYPDGQRYVIEVDTNASFEVRWGGERQHIRYGGGQWVSELTELWREQRNSTPQDPALTPVGDICGDGDSNLQRTIDRHDAAGFLCSTDPETGKPRGATLQLDRELVQSIVQEAPASSIPWPEGGMLNWSGEDIILVDDYGERLRMIHTADDTWLWSDPSGQWEWSPSSALRQQIALPEQSLPGGPLVVPTPS